MLYNTIKNVIDHMIDEMSAGKEECHEIISYNLIRDQNIPITIETKLIYHLHKIKISLHCPFLLVDPDIVFEEIYQPGVEEDQFRLMRLIAKFTTILDRLKQWVEEEVPDMIRWGEGVVFDKTGRAKKIPYPISNAKTNKAQKQKEKKINKEKG